MILNKHKRKTWKKKKWNKHTWYHSYFCFV